MVALLLTAIVTIALSVALASVAMNAALWLVHSASRARAQALVQLEAVPAATNVVTLETVRERQRRAA